MNDPGDDLTAIADPLRSARPIPSSAFVGVLRQRIAGASAQAQALSRRRLRLQIAGYALAGALLLALALISAAGTGPLGG
jgi:hypothetical protein